MQVLISINNFFKSICTKLSKIQFLTGNSLKIIAIIIMFIDHFTKSFVVYNYKSIIGLISISYNSFNTFIAKWIIPIGSIAFPIFCFLLVEGFCNTKHLKKYFFLIFLFAIISEIPFDLALFNEKINLLHTFPFYWGCQNVLFTLFLGLTTIWGITMIDKLLNHDIKDKILIFVFSGILIATTSLLANKLACDYGAYGVLLVTVLYLARKNRIYQIISYLILFILFEHTFGLPQVIISFLMLLYNGKRGELKIKYFGYIFYPIHLMSLYLLCLIKT